IADVELTALANPGSPVLVRVASADVYKGANIAMHPVLASVTMSVMRRDGRQFLHITSIKPVDSENIHLFLDLTEGNRRNVRAVTLWLTPDPTPAPRPPVAPPPVAEPLPPPVAAPVPVPYKAPPAAPEPAPRVERPRQVRVISVPSAGAACPQAQFSQEQIQACAAMDSKNGLLSAQIVELEDKVKRLQLAIEGGASVPAVAAKKAEPAAPPPPAKPVVKSAGGFPWLLVIGSVLGLLVIGGAVWFVLSRRKGKTVETAAADSVAWYSRLAGPFRRKVKVETVVVEEVKDA
ncbi:MAG: hypothetical protein WKG03_22460, partial [Telluria sp.]